MKTLAISIGLSCSALGALAWITEPDRLPPSPVPTAAEVAVVEVAPLGISRERMEVVPPSAAPVLVGGTSESSQPEPPPSPAPVDVLATARAYFDAQARVEELSSGIPSDVDRTNVSRDLYPDYVAAVDEFARVSVDFAAVTPPTANEPLPLINVYASDEGLARTYKGLSRPELLFENWQLGRAAYAESKRILDERLEHGPYEATQLNQMAVG